MNVFRTLGSILLLLAASNLFAATRTTSQSGNWSATATWGGNPAPVAGDDVIINGGFTVTVDVANAACLSLQLGGSTLGTGSGTITFNSGSQLTVSGAVTLGVTTNTPGTLNMASGGTLLCEGFVDNRLGTWTAGTGTINLTATNTVPNNNNIDFNNLIVSGGTTSFSRNITIAGNLTIDLGAVLDGGANTTTVNGNWTNDGTFNGNTGTVSFDRNGSQTIAGTGLNNFNLIRLNEGTSIANTLEVTAAHFSAPDAFLQLTNGTFKMSGSFTFTNSFLPGPSYNIPTTTGLWLNNANATVTPQGGTVSVRGLLRLTAGTWNIGNGADSSVVYVSGSSFVIEGGSLHIAGRLSGNNASSTTAYTQSGGTVTVVEQGSTDPTFAGFELGNAGSSFTMSGGTLVVANATGATADFRNLASTASVTGGTLQIGDASTQNAQTIRINSARPVGNLLVSGATAQAVKPTAQIVSSTLNVVGSVAVEAGTTLDANGFNMTVGGDWTDNGTFNGAGGTVTFNGAGAQNLARTGGETFNAFVVNKSGGSLTLQSDAAVNGGFTLTLGSLNVGGQSLTLNSTVTAASGTLSSGSAGTTIYNQPSDGQTVLAGAYGNLTFNDFNKTLPANGTIGVSGTFTPGAATGHTVAGSTFDFNGASQAIPVFPYVQLTLSGSGTKSSAGPIAVTGGFANGAGVIYTGAASLDLFGATNTNAGTLTTPTLLLEPGATLTNGSTMTVGLAAAGLGSLVQSASAVLNFGGKVDSVALDASALGNTVNYTGDSQAVRPATYYHLVLSGSGAPTLAGVSTINGDFTLAGTVAVFTTGNFTIGGDLTIGANTSLVSDSSTFTLHGNFFRTGTFADSFGYIIFAGSAPQTTNAATFGNVTVANSLGVSMTGDVRIAGLLTLSAGAFKIGAHNLQLDGAISSAGGTLTGGSTSNLEIGAGSFVGTTIPPITLHDLMLVRDATDLLGGDITIRGTLTIGSGHLQTGAFSVTLDPSATLIEAQGHAVVGTVKTTRTVGAVTGTESFGGIGVDVALNGVAPGATGVVRTTGVASTGSGHSSIARYFEITPAVDSGLNAGLVFHYDTTELSTQNPSALELYLSNDNGSTWTNQGGTASALLRTVTAAGINTLSRWTLSDTSDRLGATPLPSVSGILPASKHIGDAGFTMTVNGSGFVSGKSTVRFNGSDRTTTYVSTAQLTASISAADLLALGSFPVTVFNADGGGVSLAQTFTVIPLPPAKLTFETAANGSGTIVPAQSLASGNAITIYAITRDSLNNFVANVGADSWTLSHTGGVVAGDLVPSGDKKSAVFTAHVVGTAVVTGASGALTVTPTDTIRVVAGAPSSVAVETSPDGSGTVVPAQSVMSTHAITVYAVTRDGSANFVANVAADAWSLVNVTGAVVAGDLVPALDAKSAVFTANGVGSANISASSGALAVTTSGAITVTPFTGVKENGRPFVFALNQNYPNPFNPSTTISYSVAKAGFVSIVVYDMLGREVDRLVHETKEPGDYSVAWHADLLPSGAYVVRLAAGDFTAIRKMVLMR